MVSGFVVVGDATLDVTVAPSRPARFGGDVEAVIRLGPGGQGANVAVRLARRGERVSLVAPIAADAGGRLLNDALTADRVDIVPLPATRTAVVVALLDADGERSMLSDRQAIDAEYVARASADAGWIHVSAYALLDDANGDGLSGVLAQRGRETRLSLAGGSVPPEPATVARFLRRVATLRPDLMVISGEEAAAILGRPSETAADAASRLAGNATVVTVTAGSAGSAATVGGAILEVRAPELSQPALDSTGAGDAYVAALVSRLAAGAWPPAEPALRAAMEEGSRAGALVSRVVGAQARVAGEGDR
jgi:sugar/nucleoside kinase (ribokinase family)